MTNTSQVERQHSALGSLATTFTATTATTTAATAATTTPSISTLTTHTDFNAGLSPTSMMVDGYRVHPSALATSPAGNMTAVAAAQHAATLAANDVVNTSSIQENSSGVIDNPSSSKPSSGIVQETLQRSMPLGLAVVMGYIFYIYTFHVCIDYILHTQHRPIQAGIYIGPPQKTPPPPLPITTTKYQPRKVQRSVSHQSGSLHTPPTDTTPLLQSTPAVSGSSSFQYQTTSQYSHFSSTKIQSVPDQKREHRDEGHVPTGGDCDGVRIDVESDTQCQGNRAENIPIATLSISKRNGTPRWCDICKIYKPDRCHHCSECDECVLRMDHHCPWVRGCIGYNNHKFFYLFIFYTSVMTVWVVATMIPLLVEVVRKCQPDITLLEITKPRKQPPQCMVDNQWTILVVVSLILALFIVSFTLAHTIHILKNRTTIESLLDMRPTFVKLQYTRTDLPSHWPESGFSVIKLDPGDNLWDRGTRSANWKSIMGPSWWLWF
ncbi:palmitoyltransferase for Vac8p, partial [Mortierella sp. AD010]